ncbi:hypothetical protein J6590_071452 [Homalodisca vitripennis]|nr:hypothetical protein J6590_071452 [Homalodisca vitripennis]
MMPKRGTLNAIVKFMKNCIHGVDDKKVVIGKFFDMSKAFDTKSLIFHVSATNQKLLELAEEQSIRKKDLKGSLRDFTVVEQSEFGGGSDILSTAEKEYLVRHELENIRALENEKAIPGYPRILLYEGQSIFAACVHYNLLQQLFPLHDEDVLRKLGHKWYLSLFKKQPFEEIREYFGESIALYFQFLGYYTYALIVPMVLGFLQLCLAPENIALFCIINVLWASVFMECGPRGSAGRCHSLDYCSV